MADCPHCSQEFVNEEEVDQHVQMVHAEKWHGRSATSQDGDENAVGAVSPMTADTLATAGGTQRPNAEERAYARQHGSAAESEDESPEEHPEHWER